MIELGAMTVRDQESVTEVRDKVLGVVRSLHGSEVLAVRAATAVSQAARCLVPSGGGVIKLALSPGERGTTLCLHLSTHAPAIDPGPFRLFFDRVTVAGSGNSLTAELSLPAATIDEDLIARERARIARKSRAELMEDLRLKNRELEEHNERLEVTVAERTTALRHANSKMQRDLDAGAAYVRALVPPPMQGVVSIRWTYIPSSDLGGDTIGYHWLDPQHLAMYLIDVTGHGLDSALLAVTITNVIRAGSLAAVDMKRPEQVITALNQAFQGDQHGQKFFTIWYGVYEPGSRRLTWSSGGHHPAVLLRPGESAPLLLPATGPLMGCVPGMDFPAGDCIAPPSARLILFSDGLFEILRDDHLVWDFKGLLDYLQNRSSTDEALVERLLEHVREMRGQDRLDDDLSIIEAFFE